MSKRIFEGFFKSIHGGMHEEVSRGISEETSKGISYGICGRNTIYSVFMHISTHEGDSLKLSLVEIMYTQFVLK